MNDFIHQNGNCQALSISHSINILIISHKNVITFRSFSIAVSSVYQITYSIDNAIIVIATSVSSVISGPINRAYRFLNKRTHVHRKKERDRLEIISFR